MTIDAAGRPVDDYLNRTAVLGALHRHVEGLAAIPLELLPAPRVLAIDAPWGYGKSWVAARFREELSRQFEPRPVAFIDAFRYDHHDDAFAVIASVVIAALDPAKERRGRYMAAAGKLMGAAVPALARLAVKAAITKLGVDFEELRDLGSSLKDSAAEGSAKITGATVDMLFEHYARTQELQEDFQDSLNALTRDLPQPFVVIIDELDRCRPSFALEVLERIKHLFSAENVVFVLFWNSASIHESIRHTYGRDTAAEAYLSKFVALSVPLALPARQALGPGSGYSRFIERELHRLVPKAIDPAFEQALAYFAGAFGASLRDVQKAISVYSHVFRTHAETASSELAYLVLIESMQPSLYRALRSGHQDAIRAALEQLDVPDPIEGSEVLRHVWTMLKYRTDPTRFQELLARKTRGENEVDDMVVGELRGHETNVNWLDAMGALIDRALASGG